MRALRTWVITLVEAHGGDAESSDVQRPALQHRRLVASFGDLPGGAMELNMTTLRKWSSRRGGPVLNTLRSLCIGWITDSRFGRDARACCPMCRQASGHRLAHLLGCERLDRCLVGVLRLVR